MSELSARRFVADETMGANERRVRLEIVAEEMVASDKFKCSLVCANQAKIDRRRARNSRPLMANLLSAARGSSVRAQHSEHN